MGLTFGSLFAGIGGFDLALSRVGCRSLEERGRAEGCRLEFRQDGTTNALRTPSGGRNGFGIGVMATTAVRRLTPRECERLQGFPDDWNAQGAEGASISDSARYRMLGNAVAVPCVEWIARRIVDNSSKGGRQ